MRSSLRLSLALLVLVPAAAAAGGPEPPRLFERWWQQAGPRAAAAPPGCEEGVQPSGALFRICQPALVPWSGELVLYAHGYTSPRSPLALPEEADLFGPVFALRGHAFGVTSFRSNGLVVQDGLLDLAELLEIFTARFGAPSRVWLIGASQGGLIATLALERGPELYAGALAMCAPVGGFAGQVDYFGDFRVVFDALFPGLLPPSAVDVPTELIAGWDPHYDANVRPVLDDPASAPRVDALLAVTGAAWDPAVPTSREGTASDLLWYNVHATGDAVVRLGGQPFENLARLYAGSSLDAEINAGAARHAADAAARAALVAYETTGAPVGPVVTLHTTLDPIVPYRHSVEYAAKLEAAGALHEHRPVERYGHCNFEPLELIGAFDRLEALGR
jgi:pimeloyl-ACP methyl ester carboxylesterase